MRNEAGEESSRSSRGGRKGAAGEPLEAACLPDPKETGRWDGTRREETVPGEKKNEENEGSGVVLGVLFVYILFITFVFHIFALGGFRFTYSPAGSQI